MPVRVTVNWTHLQARLRAEHRTKRTMNNSKRWMETNANESGLNEIPFSSCYCMHLWSCAFSLWTQFNCFGQRDIFKRLSLVFFLYVVIIIWHVQCSCRITVYHQFLVLHFWLQKSDTFSLFVTNLNSLICSSRNAIILCFTCLFISVFL